MTSYNKKSAYNYAWSPSFFDCDDFGEKLTAKIKQFQRNYSLSVDGLCGAKTAAIVKKQHNDNYIYCGATAVPIKWNLVTDWTEKYKATKYRENYQDRQPRLFITHWDAALSSKSAFSTLEKRGLSAHFLISNKGEIHQCANTSHVLFHAGNSNNYSIGCEVSNAYYPRYQENYRKMGYGNRPIITGAKVHGRKMRDFTDFYPVQKEALKALWVAISSHYDIPLQTPLDDDGNDFESVYGKAFSDYKGIIHHYQVSAKKIDCGGISLSKLINEIKTEP